MHIEEACYLLMSANREEVQDRSFGDAEIYWSKDGKEIGAGYASYVKDTYKITVAWDETTFSFSGEDAKRLCKLGTLIKVNING